MSDLYDNARQLCLSTGLNLETVDVKAVLVHTGSGHYEFNSSQVSLAACAGVDQLVKSANFSGKSVANGVFDADDITFSDVPAGQTGDAIIIYIDIDGIDAHALLVNYRDTDHDLPITPDGTDITVVWSDGPKKIFKLGA